MNTELQQREITARQKANDFLAVAGQFHLGDLPTEGQHPKTKNLSALATSDLAQAVRLMREVDCDALRATQQKCADILKMAHSMQQTLKAGGRIFFVGCGATGRLSLSLEVLWRESVQPGHAWCDSVRSLMAGGDVALIRSIENFEDHPSYGARMLDEAGFREGDLLIASTEGGETPYVIGAALRATQVSSKNHWFLFCNPAEILIQKLERCKQVLLHPQLQKINLTVGPMAISGSTRMQASTVLMLAAGTALFETLKDHPTFDSIEQSIDSLLEHQGNLALEALPAFIEHESDCYARGQTLIYETLEYGITVLTDTTERSPTFSLSAFENRADTDAPTSLCYLCLPHTHSAHEAWESLLKRSPRPLVGWTDYEQIGGPNRLVGYDFSSSIFAWRQERRPSIQQNIFSIRRQNSDIFLALGAHTAQFPTGELSLLNEHLMLKMLLNIHSTLVMGRLGRYHGNTMTCVRPSNFKLIDRSIRYVQQMLQAEHITGYSYEDICFQCFFELEQSEVNEPIVLKTFNALKGKHSAGGSAHLGSNFVPKFSYELRAPGAR
ncbi:MAG: SIS domain-containing protein [Betaproteobacteria bacterium]|nr:SIS domain-containing protein [Betaproteobacteria bacterium]